MFLLCVFGVVLFIGAVIYALGAPEDDADDDDSSNIANTKGTGQTGNAGSGRGKLPTGHRIPSHTEHIPKRPLIITREPIPPHTSPPAARSTAPPPSTTADRIPPMPIKPKPTLPKPTTTLKPTAPKPTTPPTPLQPTTPKPTTPMPTPPKPSTAMPAPPQPASPQPTPPQTTPPQPTTPQPTTPMPTTPKPSTPMPTPPPPTTTQPTTPKPTTPMSTTPMPTPPKPTTPKPTTPMPTPPKLTPPKPTTPQPTMPKPTTPIPTPPKPTPPKPTPSKPTPPKPTTPKPTTQKPITQKSATPKSATPKPTTPKPTTPKPTTPKPTTPKPTTPKPTTPKPTTPKPTTPKPTTPKPTTPKPTTPKPTTPKPTTPKPTTPKPTTPKPTTPMPTPPKPTTLTPTTPKATTPMPTMPEPPTPKRSGQHMSGESLICTVSVAGMDRLRIPRDGICNFLFYDSLYLPEGDTLLKAPGLQLLKFLGAAALSRDTDHGCSVDIDNVQAFSDHLLEQRGKKRIIEMAKQNIIDYGFLTLDHSRSSVPRIQEALSALKDVTQLVKEVTGKTGVTVLGIYSTLKTSCQTISDVIGRGFKPSAIIVLGHISYADRYAQGCHILPPNLYGVPRDMLQKIGYGHLFWKGCKNTKIGLASQQDGVVLGRCIEQKIEFTAKIPVKVSLTLKGRRYKAKPEGDPPYVGIGNFDLLRECSRAKLNPKYEQDAPAVRVCGQLGEYKQHINFSEQYQSVVTYDRHDGYTITFDNDDSLRKKVCDARASHGSFSLAAYDVNYDHGKDTCPKWGAKGHYSRLKLVRKLNAFMRGENAGDSTHCESDSDKTW